jgi:hypothetical protein
MTMSPVQCPHCQAENEDGAAFCSECGKALPGATPTTPTVVTGDQVASTEVGQSIQAEQLQKQARGASAALIVVGVLMVAGAAFLYARFSGEAGVDAGALRTLLITNLVLAAIYVGLGLWARRNPLPAAIVGLVLFVTMIAVGAILDPTSIAQGIIVKVVVVVALAKAIHAGVKYRQLKAQMAEGEGAPPLP